jgi:hypothetical protein
MTERLHFIEVTSQNKDAFMSNQALHDQFLEAGGAIWGKDVMPLILQDLQGNQSKSLMVFTTPDEKTLIAFAMINAADTSCDKPNDCVQCKDGDRCMFIEVLGIHGNFQKTGKLRSVMNEIKQLAVSRNFTCMRLSAISPQVKGIYGRMDFSQEGTKDSCMEMKSTNWFGRGRFGRRRGRWI